MYVEWFARIGRCAKGGWAGWLRSAVAAGGGEEGGGFWYVPGIPTACSSGNICG